MNPTSIIQLDNRNLSHVEVSDDQLIMRAQHGDNNAFGELYDRHLGAIYNYIFYRLTNTQEAEDLTELVFIKAWKAINKYEIKGAPFLAWLYRISRHVVADYHRNRKAQFVDLDKHTSLHDQDNSPEENAEFWGDFDHVMRSLKQLPTVQQEVLTLRFLSGLSHDETASVMERTPQSVRVIQHRALKSLRDRLETAAESINPINPAST